MYKSYQPSKTCGKKKKRKRKTFFFLAHIFKSSDIYFNNFDWILKLVMYAMAKFGNVGQLNWKIVVDVYNCMKWGMRSF